MNDSDNPGLRPEDAREIESLWRKRWLWAFLTWAFLFAGMLFLAGPMKRLKEARKKGDLEAARAANARMQTVTLISVPIGTVIMILYFGFGLHRY